MSVSLTPIEDEPLRFGYTLGDVGRLVRLALRDHRTSLGLDQQDREETAWFGVVELLLAAQRQPTSKELYLAGLGSLDRLVKGEISTHGFEAKAGRSGGPCKAPRFRAYWGGWTRSDPEPAFVSAIIEITTLQRILPRLSETQREALLALAAYDDQEQAADALGMDASAFRARLTLARRTALALWHEGETPRPLQPGGARRASRRTLRPNIAQVLSREDLRMVVLTDAREVFQASDTDRLRSRDLLQHLAANHPYIYGAWTLEDLGQAMRLSGVTRHRTTLGSRATGRAVVYLLTDIEDALDGTADEPRPDPVQTILLTWLRQHQQHSKTREKVGKPTRADLVDLITTAGPAGITLTEVKHRLPGISPSSVSVWLAAEVTAGTITRLARGRYAATAPRHQVQHSERYAAHHATRELAGSGATS